MSRIPSLSERSKPLQDLVDAASKLQKRSASVARVRSNQQDRTRERIAQETGNTSGDTDPDEDTTPLS